MGRVGAIILAAGGSTRLGRPKQLLVYEGRTLLERVVHTASLVGCTPIVVVLGHAAAECKNVLPPTVTVVINTAWARGMGGSLRLGAEAMPAEVDRAFVLLCDQARICATSLRQLDDEMKRTEAAACVSAYSGTLGPPVLIRKSLIERLKNWPDAHGAKHLWADSTLGVQTVDVPEAEFDVDTEADVERVLNS